MKFKKALSLLAVAATATANNYDENGVVRVDPMDSMGLDFEFPESLNGSDLMEPAAEYLIEQGRITSEQYEMWQQLRNNLPAG